MKNIGYEGLKSLKAFYFCMEIFIKKFKNIKEYIDNEFYKV